MISILNSLSLALIQSYQHNKIFLFRKYYQKFLDVFYYGFKNKLLEVDSFNKDNSVAQSLKIRTEWTNSIKSDVIILNNIFVNTKRHLTFDIFHLIPYVIMKNKYNLFIKKLRNVS